MLEKIKETAAFIKAKVNDIPTTAIILGTGLGELVNHIDITDELNYQDNLISLFQQLRDTAEN